MKPTALILITMLAFVSACAHSQGTSYEISGAGPIKIVMTSTEKSWEAILYNENTGKAWFRFPTYWRIIKEKEELPKSHYIVRMIGIGGEYWAAIRMDTQSGRCWTVNESWVEIENNPILLGTNGQFNFEFISRNSSWNAVVYNETTGEAWTISSNRWQKIKEDRIVPQSRYLVRMTGGHEWGGLAIRTDTRTGRCWEIEQMPGYIQWREMEMEKK